MILYNIGDLDMSVGELTLRGCYLGANCSYNVKKMVENGYLMQERSSHDRRSVRVRLSEKGLALHQKLKRMHERHIASLAQGVVQADDMIAAHRTLRRLERFCSHIASVSPLIPFSSMGPGPGAGADGGKARFAVGAQRA
jgi:DNA-binding MarR family transcriptional regulator